MYTPRSRRIRRFVKRLQFYLEVESDDALGAEAAREGISKAEIIRRLVTNHLGRSVDVIRSTTWSDASTASRAARRRGVRVMKFVDTSSG